MDEVSVDVGHFPESRLRLAVAGVRRILRLRLSQIRPLRGSAAEHRNTDAVKEIPDGLLPERPKAAKQNSDDPALREYNAYLAELAKADNDNDRKQNRTTA